MANVRVLQSSNLLLQRHGSGVRLVTCVSTDTPFELSQHMAIAATLPDLQGASRQHMHLPKVHYIEIREHIHSEATTDNRI